MGEVGGVGLEVLVGDAVGGEYYGEGAVSAGGGWL